MCALAVRATIVSINVKRRYSKGSDPQTRGAFGSGSPALQRPQQNESAGQIRRDIGRSGKGNWKVRVSIRIRKNAPKVEKKLRGVTLSKTR